MTRLRFADAELLAPGRQRASLAEVYETFVLNAPFRAERQRIWDAFLVYRRDVLELLPSARLWVNGGFVTLKTWAAPHDIDVCIAAPQSELKAALDRLRPLLTYGEEADRVQPMAGLVDGFVTVSPGQPSSNASYWHHQWMRVKLPDGTEDSSRLKGYVEVEA